MSASIRASDLVVEHPTDRGTVRALECGHLAIDAGTNVAVMGPSGCGKSTLLGLLAGLAVPTRGRVMIGRVEVSALSERERTSFRRHRIGVVYQADNLLPHLTVEENVALQRSISRSSRTRGAVHELLARLGLETLRTRLPDQLSGGQRQRVAVARAIVHHPDVVLADEPTGALDPENARAVIELLVEVTRSTGTTMVVVTHDPLVAEHLDETIRLARPREPVGV